MKVRSSVAIVAGSIIAIALTGCSIAATDAAGATSKFSSSCSTSNPTVGVSLPNAVNPYYTAMQQSFEDNGKKLGFTIKVAIANDSDSHQLSQVQTFIQQKVCAVALNAVNSGPAAASVAALNRAHIPVFTVNVIVDPASLKAQNASIVQHVGVDQVAGGSQMATQALNDLGATANIVAGVVRDPDRVPTDQRDEGFVDVLKTNPNATVLPPVDNEADPSVASRVMSDLLSNPSVNVIFADSGPAAVGALQAITQAGKQGGVKLYAFCAADTVLTYIYRACSAQEPARYAQVLLTNLKSYLAGKSVEKTVLKAPRVFFKGQRPGRSEVG